MSAIILENNTQAVSFKNEMLSCTFLKIDSLCIAQVKYEINNIANNAPNLVKNLPLILDCNLHEEMIEQANADEFFKELNQLSLNIVGIIDNFWTRKLNPPWPLIFNNKKHKAKSIENFKTRRIEHRIRSGERIEAMDSHLIILGDVGSGAEVCAAGNIYVLGSIQGKVFAGMNGAEQACIVCQNLDYELIAIAGIYSINDGIYEQHSGNLKISLKQGSLKYEKFK